MKNVIIFAVRNEHVGELPVYPYLTNDISVVAENFRKKYDYLPGYVYVMKDWPDTMYAVVNPEFIGDKKEVLTIPFDYARTFLIKKALPYLYQSPAA